MIELFKLIGLPYTQKIRKIIKILETLENDCAVCPATTPASSVVLSCDAFYIEGLCRHLMDIYPDDASITAIIDTYHKAVCSAPVLIGVYRTLFNTMRHALYRKTGVQPSEWDLIAPGLRYGTKQPESKSPAMDTESSSATDTQSDAVSPVRPFFPGIYVYVEDIRAPFNLGSIFRTAEAFGVEKLLLSEGCVSPEQPRAQRSAMGCTRFLPWEYRPLEALLPDIPVFALETGGVPITSFQFPQHGVVLIGSEELGLSAEALKRASAGVVSIPMKGIKASLNVAVAFGILMQYWTASLQRS